MKCSCCLPPLLARMFKGRRDSQAQLATQSSQVVDQPKDLTMNELGFVASTRGEANSPRTLRQNDHLEAISTKHKKQTTRVFPKDNPYQ